MDRIHLARCLFGKQPGFTASPNRPYIATFKQIVALRLHHDEEGSNAEICNRRTSATSASCSLAMPLSILALLYSCQGYLRTHVASRYGDTLCCDQFIQFVLQVKNLTPPLGSARHTKLSSFSHFLFVGAIAYASNSKTINHFCTGEL